MAKPNPIRLYATTPVAILLAVAASACSTGEQNADAAEEATAADAERKTSPDPKVANSSSPYAAMSPFELRYAYDSDGGECGYDDPMFVKLGSEALTLGANEISILRNDDAGETRDLTLEMTEGGEIISRAYQITFAEDGEKLLLVSEGTAEPTPRLRCVDVIE